MQVLAIITSLSRLVIFVLTLLLLAACGGGGGSSDKKSDTDSGSVTVETPDGAGGDDLPADTGGDSSSDSDNDPDRSADGNQRGAPLIAGLLTDQGLIGPGRIVDATIAFTGTANRGDVVELYLNGQMAGSSMARDDGSWMLDYSVISLAPGTYVCTLNAVASDGSEIPSAATFTFIYDPAAPLAPVISGITADTATALDGITSDNTLLISGTAEAGSTLELFLNNAVIASVPVDGAGNWMVDYTAVTLPDGIYNLSAESIYLTLRSATSPLFPLVVDTQSPLVPSIQSINPDTGISTTDGITTNPNLILNGTAEPNAVVRVRLGGVLVGSTTAAVDGSWNFNYGAVNLAEGTHQFSAMQMDRAGNTSDWSAPYAVVVDVTPPAAVTSQNVGPDTGLAGDGITSANQLILSGTANVGDWVRVYRDGSEIGLVEVAGDGSWAFDYSAVTLADGSYAFTTVVSDVAGNLSPSSAVMDIVVDTAAPAAPSINTFSDDTGVLGDQLTADATPTLQGSAEPASVINVLLDGVAQGTAVADGAGVWQFPVTGAGLASAAYQFTATATDAAGNQSAASAVFNLVVDTIPPAAPVVAGISPDNGTLGDGITNVAALTFSGTAEAGSSVFVFINGVQTAVRTADGAGNWALDHTGTILADGSYQLTARAQDAAGNLSPLSSPFALTIDTSALATPVISGIDQDSGVVGDGVTNVANLVFNGTAAPGSAVTLLVNALPVGFTTASGAGNWNYDHGAVTLPDGTYAISVIAANLAGTSVTSALYTLTVDTAAPTAPVVVAITTDTGVAGDGVTSDNTLLISGTAEANATVTVLLNAVSIGTTIANGAGNWSIDHTSTALPDNNYAITATASDLAANTSLASSALNITIDTGVPSAPSVTGITTDSGTAGDGITSDNTLVISGTAEANVSVNVLIDGVSIGTTTASGAGTWSFDHSGTVLADGSYAVTAVATDLSGNISVASAPFIITVDTGVPAVPVITGITSDSGIAGDGLTNDTTLLVNGTADPNVRVNLLIDNVPIGTATASGAGSWSFDYTGTTLAAGNYAFTATASDSAGNTSAESAAFDVSIDTTAPVISAVSPVDDDTDVLLAANLVITFDSVVLVQSGNITIRNSADNSIFEQIPVGDARVTGSGTATITINPTATFVAGNGYYVQIDSTAFIDAAGNGYAGISDTTTWNFAGHNIELTGSTPADNATAVLLNSALVLNFSVAALANSGNIVIRHSSDGSVFESIAVGSGQVSGTGTTTVTVTPSDVFLPDTGYYVEIDAGTFVSGNGASFAGISGNSTLNFTTANPPVPTVVNVTSSTANGTYSQNAVIAIQVEFSQLVNVTLGTPQLLLDLEGIDRAASYVSGSGSDTLVFSYTVRFGDVSPDLEYVAATALGLNGARIRSAEYVNANLTLPNPGAAGSLAANKNLVIAASTIDVANFTSADGFQVQGSTAGEHVGWAVRGIGDVNGDGFEDFVTGAPYNSSSAGVAYIVYGQAGATRSNINTSTISNGTNGFRIIGQSMLDYLGASVGGAGDINDDGYDDIIVVAPRDDDYNTDAGIVYVIFGRASHSDVSIGSFNSSHGFRITTAELGAAIGDSFTGYTSNGQAIDSGGDFNGDGIQDLVLGIRFSDRNGLDSGKAYVIFGRTGSTRADVNLDLINPTGPDGVLIQGAGAGWQLGQAARFVGDYDADGYDDVVVSAIYSNGVTSDGGQSFLIFGSPGPIFNAVDVASLNGGSGFKISSTTSWGVLGHSVAGGDFNGDGINDLFISQNGYNITVGAAHVIYGDAGGAYANIDVDTMLSSTGYSIFGANIGEYLGHSLSRAGDFNGDGLDDLLIASYLRDDNGADSGAAWLITGQAGTSRSNLAIGSLDILDGFRMAGGGIGDHFGQSTAFGDINGDGLSDLIVGATWGDNASIDGGETLVLWGREFQSVIVEGLTGTSGADNLVGTSGNDILVGGGGADAISAGAGDDLVIVSDTDFVRIDGGAGTDTLAFSAGLNTLDLAAMGPEVIRGIERIDLANLGNTLRVSKAGVQALSRTSRAVFVRGGSADRVESILGDAWCYTGTRVVAGVTYHVYLDNGAILYIEFGIDHADVGGFNSTQTYTFNTTAGGANVSSAVTNFPVLIRVSNTIRNTLRPGRADIRFTDRDQITWLPYEIEIGASGELFVWVLVPQVDGNSNSDYIVMHYNDKVDDAVPDRQNPAKVWVDYAGVWHFSEASGNALDSTAYQNHGAQTGTVSRESSFIGRGVRFDSATERFTVPYDASFNVSGKNFSVELWLDGTSNCTTDPLFIKDYMTGVSRGEGTSRFWRIMTGGAFPIWAGGFVGSPGAQIGDTGGTDQLNSPGWLSSDCSNHMVLDHNQSYGTRLYLNGSETFTDNSVRNMENLQALIIGNSGGNSDMRIDEVRIMSQSPSAARVRLSYVNQTGTSLVSP